MTPMAPDRVGAVASSDGPSQRPTHADDRRPAETLTSGGFAIPPLPSSQAETRDDKNIEGQQQQIQSTDERFSQSDPRSAEGSQASNATSTSDQVFTPTASDPSNNQDSQTSQLHALSALAAAQDRMVADDGASRKRMADGEVKSPIKGHSRNTSAISMVSTTSTIGELSSDLRTRLSYAMVKVNNGWQAHSLDEVESFSQAVSPTSSSGTANAHRRNGSSASPHRPSVHFANDPVRRGSKSPPTLANRPTLAPPATIRPTIGMPHPRRNSNSHYTPTLLSHSHSASPRTPALNTNLGAQRPEQALYSPHQNVREQDAIESLLFMSSPNNSANLKHSFSPAGSPGPNSQPAPRSTGAAGRQTLPGGPGNRKALPTGRPAGGPVKRVGFDPSAAMMPDSPMDVDSPYNSPRGMPRRRTDAGGNHIRSALSLPSALGLSSHVSRRKPISDKDIDQMLDSRGDGNNSSDDEDIPLPPRRNGFAGTVGV